MAFGGTTYAGSWEPPRRDRGYLGTVAPARRTPNFAVAPQVPRATQQNNQAADLLQSLYDELSKGGPQAVTQTAERTTKQARSPALESNIQGYTDQLNQLSQGMTGAYGGVQDTFTDLMASLADAYRVQASDVAGAQREGALASGLTPAEASGMGTEASMDILNQMFPQIAQLEQQRAQQDVMLQESLAQLQQGNYLPFIQNVVAPYLQNVAGQTERTQAESTDPYQHYGMLSNIAESMSQRDLQQQQLGQGEDQFAQELAFRREQLGSSEEQFYAGLRAEEDRFNEGLSAEQASQQTSIEARREQAILESSLRGDLDRQSWERAVEEMGMDSEVEINELYGQAWRAAWDAYQPLWEMSQQQENTNADT